jgi:hypothetical protein
MSEESVDERRHPQPHRLLLAPLAAPADAKAITCLDNRKWDHKTVLCGLNDTAALTFCEVETAPSSM